MAALMLATATTNKQCNHITGDSERTLKIRALKTLRCGYLPANPPISMEMKLKLADNEEQTFTSGDTATLNPNEVLDLVCIARGYPRPSLNLTGPLVTDSPSVANNVTITISNTATAGLNKVRYCHKYITIKGTLVLSRPKPITN